MQNTLHILFTLSLLAFVALASNELIQERITHGQDALRKLLTVGVEGCTKEEVLDSANFASNFILPTRKVLKSMKSTPIQLYSNLTKAILSPNHADNANEHYVSRRRQLRKTPTFNKFDARFCRDVVVIDKIKRSVNWEKLDGPSSEGEVMCEALFFYRLVSFEDAVACLDAIPPIKLPAKTFSNFVADMYFGEAARPDLSYEYDKEGKKWLTNILQKHRGGYHVRPASLMRRFVRKIEDSVDNKLWSNYMQAMMTVHFSAVLMRASKTFGVKDLHNYICDNNIHKEYVFASRKLTPKTKLEKQKGHAFLRTFKLNASGDTADMGIINSGAGTRFHDQKDFDLSQLPDTVSKDPKKTSVTRYIPFVLYEVVPKKDWTPALGVPKSIEQAYFDHKLKRRVFEYQDWQYIDNQRGGTCTAMSLWSALYWFERESQQKLETFRLNLYLEILKVAAGELDKLRTNLEALDLKRSKFVYGKSEWRRLSKEIKKKSDEEDDYLLYFSVGFNAAIRSIRHLHSDPFKQALDMTAVMQRYAVFYKSQEDKRYWQLVKPQIDDLYKSTHDRILRLEALPRVSVMPKLSASELVHVNQVSHTTRIKSPLEFVKAVISGTEIKCQSRAFLASIISGVDVLDLQTHHQDLILRALIKEARSLRGGRTPIFELVERLITNYGFKLFPSYKVPSSKVIDFSTNIHQVVELDEDMEVQQFAANCSAFDSPAKSLLVTANDSLKAVKEALLEVSPIVVNLEETVEYKLHRRLIDHVSAELQSMEPHLYAQYLSDLIMDTEHTGVAECIDSFKPSEEWSQDDRLLLERAAQGSGTHEDRVREYLSRLVIAT